MRNAFLTRAGAVAAAAFAARRAVGFALDERRLEADTALQRAAPVAIRLYRLYHVHARIARAAGDTDRAGRMDSNAATILKVVADLRAECDALVVAPLPRQFLKVAFNPFAVVGWDKALHEALYNSAPDAIRIVQPILRALAHRLNALAARAGRLLHRATRASALATAHTA